MMAGESTIVHNLSNAAVSEPRRALGIYDDFLPGERHLWNCGMITTRCCAGLGQWTAPVFM